MHIYIYIYMYGVARVKCSGQINCSPRGGPGKLQLERSTNGSCVTMPILYHYY